MCFAAAVIADIQVRLSILLDWLALGLIRYGYYIDHVAIDFGRLLTRQCCR